jgi:hypothetical protein
VLTLTEDEAEILYNHLDTSILEEIRNVAEDYDNMHYLVTLCNIYQRCKAVCDAKHERGDTDGSELCSL